MTLVPKLDYRIIQDFLVALDCPRSLTVAVLLRYGEFAQIVSLGFNPLCYNTQAEAANSLQATELLRKHEDLETLIDRAGVALEAFSKAELQCEETNNRLLADKLHDSLIISVRQKIAAVLGDFDMEEFFQFAGWGPGVTLTRTGKEATITNKFRDYVETGQPLLSFVSPAFRAAYPMWHPKVKLTNYNKVITVPKNAKTDRVIAVEPSLNLWFQKALGTMIRRRLRKNGIDLNDQTVNQRLCAVASKTGELATVDFSAASDTISYLTVMELLPWKWFKLLDILRSPRGIIGGDQFVEYQKFSSMGNGYTFELESLIFFAIASAICDQGSIVSIYGDDLIVPTKFEGPLLAAFDFFGFTINQGKSFFTSPYRESCGKHFWNGSDITPIYLRRFLSNHREIYSFHNRVVELSRRSIAPGFRDKRFRGVTNALVNACPKGRRYPIPIGMGDGGFAVDISDLFQKSWSVVITRNRRYQRGWNIFHLTFTPRLKHEDDGAVLLMALYGHWKRGDQIGESTFKGVPQPRQGRWILTQSFVSDWPDLGFWI